MYLNPFPHKESQRSENNMASGNIFGLAVSLVLLVTVVTSVLIPLFTGANTTDWSAPMIAIFSLGGLIAVAGVVVFTGRALGVIQ